MATERWFELLDTIGVEPTHLTDPATGEPVANKAAGELQPAQEWGFTMGVMTPVLHGDKLLETKETYKVVLTPIPGTRIYKVDDERVAVAVAQETHLVREIDPPAQKDLKDARKDTEAARQSPAKKEKE